MIVGCVGGRRQHPGAGIVAFGWFAWCGWWYIRLREVGRSRQ